MTLHACTPFPACGFKVGFSVRKKLYRHAVDRNHVKRRLRELVRLQRACLAPDVWLVLQAHSGVPAAPWSALGSEFQTLCQSAGLLRA